MTYGFSSIHESTNHLQLVSILSQFTYVVFLELFTFIYSFIYLLPLFFQLDADSPQTCDGIYFVLLSVSIQ